MTNTNQYSDRVRFNWGYHDGAFDVRCGRAPVWSAPHYDRVYETGYYYGRNAYLHDEPTESSDHAWTEAINVGDIHEATK
jgi:hypothetical protein